MNGDSSTPGPPDGDWPSLLRRIGAGGPEEDLGRVVEELSAVQARRREQRYESVLAGARAALERGDLAAARTDAEIACGVDPVRWEAHRILGEILERGGDAAGALRRYFTAVHLGWESEDAKAALRRVGSAA